MVLEIGRAGEQESSIRLGQCYHWMPVEKDLDVAFQWYLKSAQQGYGNGQLFVGYSIDVGQV